MYGEFIWDGKCSNIYFQILAVKLPKINILKITLLIYKFLK
jgi:hypothetical protein